MAEHERSEFRFGLRHVGENMAIAGYLYKLVFGGTHYGQEEWSFSLHLHSAALYIPVPADYVAGITAYFATQGAAISSSTKLEYVKMNPINAVTGKYADTGVSYTHVLPASVAGVKGNVAPQLTLAVSTRTPFARGRGHAGRFYPPGTCSAGDYGDDGRINTVAQASSRLAASALLRSINLVAAPKIVIYSKLAQIVNPVTGVSVGRVVDTQRRRRSSLAEEPVFEAL